MYFFYQYLINFWWMCHWIFHSYHCWIFEGFVNNQSVTCSEILALWIKKSWQDSSSPNLFEVRALFYFLEAGKGNSCCWCLCCPKLLHIPVFHHLARTNKEWFLSDLLFLSGLLFLGYSWSHGASGHFRKKC